MLTYDVIIRLNMIYFHCIFSLRNIHNENWSFLYANLCQSLKSFAVFLFAWSQTCNIFPLIYLAVKMEFIFKNQQKQWFSLILKNALSTDVHWIDISCCKPVQRNRLLHIGEWKNAYKRDWSCIHIKPWEWTQTATFNIRIA